MLPPLARLCALFLLGSVVSQACAQQPAPSASPGAAQSPTSAATPPPAAPQAPADAPGSSLVTYQFGLLKKGPKWTPAQTDETKLIQEGHLANIRRLADEGKLAVAGPLEAAAGSDLRGIFVFKAASIDEAQALTATDPAVKAGRLTIELYSFLGTSGLGTRYLESKAKGAPGEMTRYQLVLMKDGRHFDPKAENDNNALALARRSWMATLAKQNSLLLAGPFSGPGAYRGLLVLGGATPEAVGAEIASDPMVKTERMAFEVHTWWVQKGILD